MIYGQNRTELRKVFVTAWQKHLQKQPMETLEKTIAQLLLQHPEYQSYFADDSALEKDFFGEAGQVNPFLHLGMHLSIVEQLSTDRPPGIIGLYQQLSAKAGSAHEAEHIMIDVLGELLWQAQNSGQPPDENIYLENLRKRLGA